MRLSVVLVTHGSEEDVEPCVRALRRNAPPFPHELIAVDSGSDDATVERLSALDVATVELATNVGFARAANLGAARARGTFLLFLNPDCRVTAGALESLVDFLERRPAAGAVGPLLVDGRGRVQWTGGRFPAPARMALDACAGRAYRRVEPRVDGRVDWALGACLLLPAVVFRSVGGFDEGYFLYGEDKDLCRRLWDSHWSVHTDLASHVIHRGGGSGGDARSLGIHFYRAQARYFERHHRRPLVWARLLRAAVAARRAWMRLGSVGPTPMRARAARALAFHDGARMLRGRR